jgi:hypothetical protein
MQMKTQKATTAKTTKKAIKDAKASKQAAAKGSKQPKEARSGSKKEIVLKLLRREGGATLAELAKRLFKASYAARRAASQRLNTSTRGFDRFLLF